MPDPATLPNNQLLEKFKQQEVVVGQQKLELNKKDDELATKDDIIKQLEQKNKDLELAYNKLWRERFEARSERYIRDPDSNGSVSSV